ncbi:MAG: substrate-binding domain-containing protein [Lachnospiraceae bacterium]|nr:substrate-binding domain-containing protein [Lachnospiraceae bacterium]
MKMSKPFRICLVLLLCLTLTGCQAARVSPSRQYNVWFIAKSTSTGFWRSAFSGANVAKSEYNLQLTICGPDTEEDYEAQNAFIYDAIADHADAIVFSSISYTENAAAIDAAADAGIKVVVIDSNVNSKKVSARIGTDNVAAGKKAASVAIDAGYDSLVIGIVNFDLTSRNGQEREEGFRTAIKESGIGAEIYTINVVTDIEVAKEETKQLLLAHPEINVIVGLNEPLAVGAAEAVAELGLGDSVTMIGMDTNVRCIDLMRTGNVSALIAQNPYAMGYMGVEACYELLEGASYDPDVWIDTPTILVLEETMFSPESQRALFSFE